MCVADGVDTQHLAALSAIELLASFHVLPHSVQSILHRARLAVHRLAIVVEYVGARVGERPGDVAGEADDEAGRTRNGHAIDIQLARYDEMGFEPDARQSEFEVRIAGKQGVSAFRASGRYRPIVRREESRDFRVIARPVAARQQGEQGECCRVRSARRGNRVEVVTRRAAPVRLNGLLDRGVERKECARRRRTHQRLGRHAFGLAIGVGQRETHSGIQVQRVDGTPARRAHAEQLILHRPFGTRCIIDVGVHTVAVGLKQAALDRRRIQRGQLALGTAGHSQVSRLAVGDNTCLADEFGEGASSRASLQLHLEQPITRYHVA